MVKKVTFLCFRGAIAPIALPWIRPCPQPWTVNAVKRYTRRC